jgi:dolichol kinase
MGDAILAAASFAAVGAGLAGCVVVRRAGMASTHVRDVLHVCAGLIWVLTWPWWGSRLWATTIVGAAALVTAAIPWLARRSRFAARLEASVTGGDERWAGLVHYTVAFAALTAVGLGTLAAAVALLALALGDGIGGFVGRRWGRLTYRIPGGTRKTLEGSLTVALMTFAGAWLASSWLGIPLAAEAALAAAALAALAEAAAPRWSSDNLLVPAAVWGLLAALGY